MLPRLPGHAIFSAERRARIEVGRCYRASHFEGDKRPMRLAKTLYSTTLSSVQNIWTDEPQPPQLSGS